MKNTRIGLLPAMLLVCRLAAAQTVDQGKSFLYYERLNSMSLNFKASALAGSISSTF